MTQDKMEQKLEHIAKVLTGMIRNSTSGLTKEMCDYIDTHKGIKVVDYENWGPASIEVEINTKSGVKHKRFLLHEELEEYNVCD